MTPDQLADATAFLFGVRRTDLFGDNRTARVVEARQALAWALRQQQWSLVSIGAYLRRDHTTIMYALKTIERQAARNARLAQRLEALRQPIEPCTTWTARILALEGKVAELEARLKELP